MQQEIGQEEIKAKIAQLKNNWARLRNLCGPRGVSRETFERYADEIENLESKLKA